MQLKPFSIQGFTLIELMIVVAIIGILSAIAIPQFAIYRQKAFNISALSDLHNLMTAEEAEYSLTQSYTPIAGNIGPAWLFGNTKFISKDIGFSIITGNSNAEFAAYTAHTQGSKEYAGDSQGKLFFKLISNGATAAQNETS